MKELKTIRDFIRYAASEFNAAQLYYGHGTDNAWDEAIALVLHSLHLAHDIQPVFLEARLVQSEKDKLTDLITQRIQKRLPVPYLTHEAWFAGLSFYVDERVLIPRSPIAELIENQFEPWLNNSPVNEILDLCTGSGCIAIACAKAFPEAQITASDLSKDALAVASINTLRHQVTEQIQLIESDLFAALPQKKYDIIVTNPPYVDAADMFELPQEYLHEPRLALAAGEDGLDIATRILQQASDFLSPQGLLVLEVGNSETALTEKYPDAPFIWPEFERCGGGVLVISAQALQASQHLFKK